MQAKLTAARWEVGSVVGLVLLSIPLILFRLGSYSLVNGDEGFYHSVAERMLESGDWLRLEFKGQHRVYDTFMNAPIQYWMKAVLIWGFGDTYWTMRILSALFGIASVLMTYRLVLFLSRPATAIVAALIQLTTLQFIYLHSARTGELETLISFLFTLIAYLFLRAVEGRHRFIAHHLCLLVLVNLKMPLLLLPIAAETLCFILLPATRPAFRSWLVSGAMILPFGFCWHVLKMIELWDAFLYTMHMMASQMAGPDLVGARTGPLHNLKFYAATLLFGAFPYALVYPIAIFEVLRRKTNPIDRSRWTVIGLYLLVLVVFFILVARYQRWYLIPAYPFLSAFTGVWLVNLVGRRWRWPHIGAASIVGALMLWLSVGVTSFNPFAEQANLIAMKVVWREIAGLGPWLGVPAAVAILSMAFASLQRRSGGRSAPAMAGGLMVGLIGYAMVRVSTPLVFLPYQAPLEQLRRDLDAAEASGISIGFPVKVAEACCMRARYYFGDDFEVVPVRVAGGYHFWLYEKDDPRAEPRRR